MERPLGAGGQAEVWLAWDSRLEEHVAVKVLAAPESPTAVERLKREVRIGRRLQHPNLVRIFEMIEAGPTIAVVMEYLPGGSLAEKIREGPLEIDQVVRIADALLDVLAGLHREGIVHRDVKPANVLFDGNGIPKLADLGTMRPLRETADLTRTHFTVGTPAYMSPEQIRGEEPAPASDLYSLGATLYQVLTGERPFEGGSEFDVARKQVSDAPVSLRQLRPDCPRWLARFVHRLLEKQPRDRWCDGEAALHAFRTRSRRPSRRGLIRLMKMAAVVVAVVTLAGIGVDRWATITAGVEDHKLVVKNAFGRILWTDDTPGIGEEAAAVDCLPDAGMEVVSSVQNGGLGSKKLSLRVSSRSGEVLRTYPVSLDPLNNGFFPGISEDLMMPHIRALDRGPGCEPLPVWIVANEQYYPGGLGLGPDLEGDDAGVFFLNSGRIKAVCPLNVDGDPCAELVVVGVNNLLGFQIFVAILNIDRPWKHSFAPELMTPEDGAAERNDMVAYALLGEVKERLIAIDTDSGPPGEVRILPGAWRVDAAGGGSIDGIGLARLRAFWPEVSKDAMAVAASKKDWREVAERLSDLYPDIWSRVSYRSGAALILAQRLAQRGDPGEGVDVLEQMCPPESRFRRVERRIGELNFLAGNRLDGRKALDQAVAATGRGFAPVDELIGLGLECALTQDAQECHRIGRLFESFKLEFYRHQLDVVFQFFGGNFLECDQALEMPLGSHHPAFVLMHWAAVESKNIQGDTVAELHSLQALEECGALATLALARSEVLNGELGDACRQAAGALRKIRERAATSWPEAAYLPLAEWAYGTVLDASGKSKEAAKHFRVASTKAPATFFGKDAARRLAAGR